MSDPGQLYVIQFDSGVIKVGMSRDADRRVAEHKVDAGRYFIEIAAQWKSAPHSAFRTNERDLIRWACWKSTRGGSAGGEYFLGLDYDATVVVARGLVDGIPAPARPEIVRPPKPVVPPADQWPWGIDHVASEANVSRQTVLYLVRTGQLRSSKNRRGPRWIEADDVRQWITGGCLVDGEPAPKLVS